jgi:hypothetical protein
MKIPVWFIIIVLAIAAFVWVRSQKPEPPPPVNSMNGYYDSLLVLSARHQKIIDSLEIVTQKRDTVIVKQIKYVKTYSEGVYRLPSDSSYKLFIQWAKLFRDSDERARYLRTDSTGLYQ